MKIQRATLATCPTASGLVVVIDVLRAFTTAGYLFDAGVEEIFLVSQVKEAFALRNQLPDCIIAGEVDGVRVPGFDMGNSPSTINAVVHPAKRVILRTTAGTQGVILAKEAGVILTTALTNVSATVRYIQNLAPESVTLIQSGLFEDRGWGDEDVACADVIEDMILNKPIYWNSIYQRVRASKAGSHYDGTRIDFPFADLQMTLERDRFHFAMLVERKDGLFCMHSVNS